MANSTYKEALKILDTQIAEYERGDNDRPGNADVVAEVIKSLKDSRSFVEQNPQLFN
jgi:hypothetical protein